MPGAFAPLGLHVVPQGHLGVYWHGGALSSKVTDPVTKAIGCQILIEK